MRSSADRSETATGARRRAAARPSRLAGAVALAMSMGLGMGTASAQDAPLRRAPAERQTVIQLAYVLGEAHALHRLCAGPSDAVWYDRMQKLEGQEASDDSFRRRLIESFNAGFASRQAQFPTCGPASEAALRRVAVQGAALARRLAGSDGAQ